MKHYQIMLSGVTSEELTSIVYEGQIDLKNSCAWKDDYHFLHLTGCLDNPSVISYSGFCESIILTLTGNIHCIDTFIKFIEVLFNANCVSLRAELLSVSIT